MFEININVNLSFFSMMNLILSFSRRRSMKRKDEVLLERASFDFDH